MSPTYWSPAPGSAARPGASSPTGCAPLATTCTPAVPDRPRRAGPPAHLGGPAVNLDTRVADIVNLVEYERLSDVIVAGHSYAGAPVAHLIYIDSAPLPEGMALIDLYTPEARPQPVDGWKLPFPGFPGSASAPACGDLATSSRR
jgi:hypothetical protein